MHEDGGCFTITNHPFLSGRPGRMRAVEALVEQMQDLPGLWVATAEEVARHVRSLGLVPRVFPQPVVDADGSAP